MNDIPQLKPDDEMLFRKLVLEDCLTLAAIRVEMPEALEGVDDISLIRKMLRIIAKGEIDE